jgi:Zn finger protein HypA/HybF involved in hydrogenase expression
MSAMVRILKHPHDHAVVLLDVPVSLNDIARQLPATLAVDLRGWVMHNESIPSLYRWGQHHGVHITDDRTAAKTHTRAHAQPMPECSVVGCSQPVKVGTVVTNCPSCGSPWVPIVHTETAAYTKTPCASCGHEQAGKFAYCSRCGAAMTYPEPETHMQIARVKLEDPVTLADALGELPVLADLPAEDPA